MKQKKNTDNQFQRYMRGPLYTILPLLIVTLLIGKEDLEKTKFLLLFVILYAVYCFTIYLYNRKLVLSDMVEFAARYDMARNTLFKDLKVPYAIFLADGKVVWENARLRNLLGDRRKDNAYLKDYIPELNKGVFPKTNECVTVEVTIDGRFYEAVMAPVKIAGTEGISFDETYVMQQCYALSLNDITDLKACKEELRASRMVTGLIYIDNYDEVMESVGEMRQSLFLAYIDRIISKYMANVDGLVKKLEKDKYFIVIKEDALETMTKDHFAFMKEVREMKSGNSIPATLSVGLGAEAETYLQSYNNARVSIDLALARGGDQVVIKTPTEISYYGGTREQTAKNTRVKARVKAEALREFIMGKEKIIVMGHKYADTDCFGAAIGIYRAATEFGKEVHIILNQVSSSIRPFYEAFKASEDYPDDLFITNGDVRKYVDSNTMVVVVDTNKPSRTECEELLEEDLMVVVLDHHRRGEKIIEDAVLSYIEPYCSSTCEMVSEVLQYMDNNLTLTHMEANSLYAGIMIDTNNFMNKTGVRTFEAAAFLQRSGADIPYVRKLFRDDIESYRAKAEIITTTEVYRKNFAIGRGTDEKVESPTIIGAQAANELLDIHGIKASFVLTEYSGKIYVSARSIDEVNVQRIMERLGGGGHLNMAGAQFGHTEMDEAIQTLKETIDAMIEEGEL